MADLKTDYKDDVLDTSVNSKRTFNIVDQDGNIIFENVTLNDTTTYSQVGDSFGASDINSSNERINKLDIDLSTHTHDSRYYTEAEIDTKFKQVNSDLSNIKVKASSSLKQAIIGRASNTSESYNELRFEISDAEHYLFRIHDNTDQLIVWHYVNGAYTKVWNWTNLNSQINTHSNTIKDITNYIGKTGDVPNGAWIDGSTKSLESIVNNMKGATLVIYYRPNDTDRQYGLDSGNYGLCVCHALGDNSSIEWTELGGGKRYYKFKCTGTWDGNWYPTTAFNTPANNGIIESAKLVSYEDGCKNNQAFLYTKSVTKNLPKGAEFGFRFVHTFKDGNHTESTKPHAMVVLYDMNGCIYMNTIQGGDWLGWKQFSSVAVEET